MKKMKKCKKLLPLLLVAVMLFTSIPAVSAADKTNLEPSTAAVPCSDHSFVLHKEESTPATYRNAGVNVWICEHCGERKEEPVSRLVPELPRGLSLTLNPSCVYDPAHFLNLNYGGLHYVSAGEIQLQKDDRYHVEVQFDPDRILNSFGLNLGPHTYADGGTLPPIWYVYDYDDNTWHQEDWEISVLLTCQPDEPSDPSEPVPAEPIEITQLIVDLPETPVAGSAIADLLQDDPEDPYTVSGSWWEIGADGVSVMRLEPGKAITPGRYELRIVAVPREGYAFKQEVYFDPIQGYLHPDENGNILLAKIYTVKPAELTVNFHLNGGLTGPSSVRVPYGDPLDLSLLSRVTHDPVDGVPVIHVGWATYPVPLLDHSTHCMGAYVQLNDTIYTLRDLELYAVYSLDENRNGIADAEEERYIADLDV